VTSDPLTAILDQLAALSEQLTRLDAREAEHHTTLTAQIAGLTGTTAPADTDPDDGYCPDPAPSWWKLAADQRQEHIARLRAWVEQVYRPGYGHLAAGLNTCWEAHDLCLYGLDVLSGLWSVLYLQPQRTTGLLSAQAEYQARILPALAEQFRAETNRCGHPRNPAPAAAPPWSRP
jgi:hypothetical protein